MPCIACAAGCHWECYSPVISDDLLAKFCCCPPVGTAPVAESVGGYKKDPTEMIDPLSTGRKEAARLKPITEGLICEWKDLLEAGGGVLPIIGCMGNPAKHIHHGPNKDTTDNSDLNLHRVCSKCHNRWHTLNDPHYGDRPPAGTPFVPSGSKWSLHNPNDKATMEQTFASELWWNTKAKNRKEGFENVRNTNGDSGLYGAGGDDNSGSEAITSSPDSNNTE